MVTPAIASPGTCAPDLEGRLLTLGQRMLEDSVALRFGAAKARVPEFGAWTYGWMQSYVTSYKILGRAVVQLGNAAVSHDPLPSTDAIARDLAEPMRQAFKERVAQASLGDGGMQQDMAHLVNALVAEWPSSSLQQRLAPLLALNPLERLEETGDAETVFIRSMRPWAARLGAVMLRVSEVGSFVAGASVLGYSIAGAPGIVVGAASGVGLAWSLDWALNRLDSSLHREAFEAQAQQAISSAEQAILQEGRTVLRDAVRAEIEARCQ